MSVNRNVYMILGYDLQKVRNKILTEEFRESERYEELTCNQCFGRVQLFDDPMSGEHLFLGFIIGEIPGDYDDCTIKTSLSDYDDMKEQIDEVFQAIYPTKEMFETQYITFTECS